MVIVAAVVVAYSPAFVAGFIWDDDAYVTRNAALRSLDGLRRIWFEPGAVPQYYPLVFTTFWIEHRLWGLDATGYHAVNVLLHAANAVLVGRILRVAGFRAAWPAAAVFALHPVHVESVAWITERKNVLSAFFYLLSLLVYLRAKQAVERRESGFASWGHAAALGLFVCALFAKTVTCSLPVAILLLVFWQDGRITRAETLRVAPFFAVGLALALVTVWMESTHVGARGADWDLSFLQRCTIAGRAVWFYVFKLLWPTNLTFVYPRWNVAVDPFGLLAALSVPVVLVALAAWRRRIGDGPLLAALYFVTTLFPALGFVNVFPMRYTFVADHYQYLGSLGVIVLACGSLAWGVRSARLRQAVLPAGLGVIAVLGVLTFRQAQIYRDAETLWRDTIAKDPSSWMAHNNLGLLLAGRGDLAGAISHYEAALKAKPDDAFAANNLGQAWAARGEMARAGEYLERAVRLDPFNAEARVNLGNLHATSGRLDAAAEQYRAALRIRPSYPDAHGNLANVLALQGDREAALAEYQQALRIDPDYADAWFNRGIVLAQLGRREEAAESLRAALRLRPGWKEASAALDDVMRSWGHAVMR